MNSNYQTLKEQDLDLNYKAKTCVTIQEEDINEELLNPDDHYNNSTSMLPN